MQVVQLKSGATLKLNLSPFAISKTLYQSILREARGISITNETDMASLYKDLFCIGMASPEVEKNLWECFKRCTYDNGSSGDLKITEDTFEPAEAREDYTQVCIEVAKANLLPFVKSLYAEFPRFQAAMQGAQT